MAPRATTTDRRLATRLAAIASFGAAVIHFAVAPAHWQEWMASGLFFAVLASFQMVWARVVLSRTTTAVLLAGIAVNVGAVTLWAMSRTVGAPFGPHTGVAELVQGADLCALLLQVYVVMGAGWALHRGRQGEPISGLANAAVVLAIGSVIVVASTVGAAGALRHGHHSSVDAETIPHALNVGHADNHHSHDAPPESSPPAAGPLGTRVTPAPTEAPLVEPDAAHGDAASDHDHHE